MRTRIATGDSDPANTVLFQFSLKLVASDLIVGCSTQCQFIEQVKAVAAAEITTMAIDPTDTQGGKQHQDQCSGVVEGP